MKKVMKFLVLDASRMRLLVVIFQKFSCERGVTPPSRALPPLGAGEEKFLWGSRRKRPQVQSCRNINIGITAKAFEIEG